MVIDKKLIQSLFDQAVVNPRLRINYDLRNTEDDMSQRMLNAMMPGTSVPIHRHPFSSESIMIICGSVDEVFYDNNGNGVEDAKKDGAELLQPTTDTVTYSDGTTEEVYGFDVPVEALDQEFDLAILGKKGKWYDHKVSVADAKAAEE